MNAITLRRHGSLTSNAASSFALIVGIFLLMEGVWGLLSPLVFGILTTNLPHAVIQIALGFAGVWVAMKPGARGYSLLVGWLLLAVGVLRFIPSADELVVDLLNVNPAVAILNIVVGVAGLYSGFVSPKQLR